MEKACTISTSVRCACLSELRTALQVCRLTNMYFALKCNTLSTCAGPISFRGL